MILITGLLMLKLIFETISTLKPYLISNKFLYIINILTVYLANINWFYNWWNSSLS